MSIPDHGGLGRSHAGPALQRRMVLIDDRHHHLANIEGFLAAGIGFVREDLADVREALLVAIPVRRDLHVAVDRIGGDGSPGESLARRHVSVFVVPQQDVAGFIDVAGPSTVPGR